MYIYTYIISCLCASILIKSKSESPIDAQHSIIDVTSSTFNECGKGLTHTDTTHQEICCYYSSFLFNFSLIHPFIKYRVLIKYCVFLKML